MSEFRLETDRLVLRAWREADRDPFFALNSDPAVMEFLPATDRATSDNAIDRMNAAQAAQGHCFWAVERKRDGAFLGFCGPMPARDPLNEVELGWRLSRDAWGRVMPARAPGRAWRGVGPISIPPRSWRSPSPPTGAAAR